uniref:Uncharacterized protein n=1 Tax=Gopherus evgoodei TaxID=1825980 RepID=A0A8C4VZK9_9SAUR
MGPRRPPELYRAPFPLYALQIHPRGLALAAGGGGAARTGRAWGLRGGPSPGCPQGSPA